MSIEHEYGKTENVLYSRSLDLLLEWGRIHLFQQRDTPLLQELEGKWEYLKAVGTPLDSGLDLLENRVRASLTILHGPATIRLDSDSAGNIMAAIKTLDQVVFLSEAMESFPTVIDLPAKFREKSDDLLYRVTIERTPPTLRLIPLNEWRRSILKNIPSQVNYLFPWYGLWVDLPADFLEILTDRFEAAARGDYHRLALDPNIVPVLLEELKSDPALLERVRRNRDSALPPVEIAGLSHRLLLLHAAEIAGRPVPEGLRETGLLLAACQAVDNRVASTVEQTENLFLAAFCAPFPDETTRKVLLDDIEAVLNRLDPASLHASNLLEPLRFWSKGRLGDKEFVRKVWSVWENRLLRAADQIDDQAVFMGAVANLRKAGFSEKRTRRFPGQWNRWWTNLKPGRFMKGGAVILIIGLILGFAFLQIRHLTPLRSFNSVESENRIIKRKIPGSDRPLQAKTPVSVPEDAAEKGPVVLKSYRNP